MNRLLDVLWFLMLSKCCWHVELEKRCIIDNNVLYEEVCGMSYPVCTGATTKLFLPINKVNLCRVLVKLFCESGKSDITPQNVAKYIIDTDNYELSVYGKKTKKWWMYIMCTEQLYSWLHLALLYWRLNKFPQLGVVVTQKWPIGLSAVLQSSMT